ncbi:M14 family metallopeptidase [Parahaliea mediterranea]|uniref:M14 family metallocarboxypeptidase n=1 Tax=Parahaliea mediterranea TaxID=651086 RepID=A0A939DJG6_9GAMM|nr:M14 family metallocarboxypeptidase [Parahaliea mediterranea]MBN7798582.1 M14 family metallocarboxypeptidase [Parahaliea mediterranea]
MSNQQNYPVGTPGTPWGESEKQEWYARQRVQRPYAGEVLAQLQPLAERFDLVQYGVLPIDPERYPLFAARSRDWTAAKPCVLVTGGVHGYETSGVQGALRFLQTEAERYGEHFNLLVVPAISPWGYETINRWNPGAVDPNRSFYADSASPEAAALMALLESLDCEFQVHVDLHETTDTDNSEFRPALAARDGIEMAVWDIPDGFYLVGDTSCPAPEFQRAVVAAVEKVTHIAPADAGNRLIGEPLQQHGVINYQARELGLCMGLTEAPYRTTTEVYPDSERVDGENCIRAQVAAVTGALDYVLAVSGSGGETTPLR